MPTFTDRQLFDEKNVQYPARDYKNTTSHLAVRTMESRETRVLRLDLGFDTHWLCDLEKRT